MLAGSKVMPIGKLLRSCWNPKLYLRSSQGDREKPFLLEESSKVHFARINQTMSSDLDWCHIGLVALISAECDLVGKWSEGCYCHPPVVKVRRKRSGAYYQQAHHSSPDCPFKCCRAPELAIGVGVKIQSAMMGSHRDEFLECVALAPARSRGQLVSSWDTATSKMFGAWSCEAITLGRKMHVVSVSCICMCVCVPACRCNMNMLSATAHIKSCNVHSAKCFRKLKLTTLPPTSVPCV